MSYQYDLPDFKRYLNDKNEKYRVDGLVFWQNRIPIPIDIFNRIFSDSGRIFSDYINHLVVSVLVYSCDEEFVSVCGMSSAEMPRREVLGKQFEVQSWLESKLTNSAVYRQIAIETAEILSLEGFLLDSNALLNSLSHHGKKYDRLHIPDPIRSMVENRVGAISVGSSNTDMIGNVVADRYDIYRSGFSDALGIIFNSLMDFRIICGGSSRGLQRLDLTIEKTAGVDIRFGRTSDGSLWEPGYEENHFVRINDEHPLLRESSEEATSILAELLYCMAEFENNQYSDSFRKMQENLRQEVSRGLWIRHD